MADNLPTVWDADPHTLVKHAILRKYLDAWFPILTRQADRLRKSFRNGESREILFVDAFAGPGEYAGGQSGSPIIAIKAACEHKVEFPFPVRLVFNEHDPKRHARLQKVLDREIAKIRQKTQVIVDPPENEDCSVLIEKLLTQYSDRQSVFGPAMVFLDQFGYSAVPMSMISEIMAHPECEVFALLDFREMNRWISDPAKASAFRRAFGGDDWEMARDMSEREQHEFLLKNYITALRTRGKCRYTATFAMFDRNGRALYRLIFCTNNLRGLEEMKKAMWAVDKTGECRFSDEDAPSQLKLLDDAFDDAWLADELKLKLRGRTLSFNELKEFVLTETPCYLFKSALKILEKEEHGSMRVFGPPDRRPGTYPDHAAKTMSFKFAKDSLF